MSKTKSTLLLITLFLSNLIICGSFVFTPTINQVYNLFPNNVGLVNFIVSGIYLVIFIAAFFAGILCDKLTPKAVFTIGCFSGAIGCSLLLLIENPIWMICMRSLFAIGYAFVQISAVSIIAQNWPDEKKRGSIMGYYNASMTAIGAILSIIAGNLAAHSLASAYHLYYIFLPVGILALFFVPSIKTTKEEKAETLDKPQDNEKKGFGGSYWTQLILFFLYNFAYSVPFIYVSVYIADNALGTPALAGYLNTTCTLVSFVLAMAFGKIFSKLGKNILSVFYPLTIVVILLLKFVPTVPTTYIAYGLVGACYVTVYTFGFTFLPTLVPEAKRSKAISFISAASTLGAFITTYVMTFVMNITGWGLSQAMIVPIIVLAIISIFEILSAKKMDISPDTQNR